VFRNTFRHLEYYHRLLILAPLPTAPPGSLEKFVLSHVRVELAWKSSRAPIVTGVSRARQSDKEFWSNSFMKLIEGGRWMLWSPPQRDRLMVFDLDLWQMLPDVLIEPPHTKDRFRYIDVEVNESERGLTFNIAFQWTNRAFSRSHTFSFI